MELNILTDIVIIFALSLLVNLLFTRFKVPSVVGYLLTGILAGPHLLGLIHGEHDIELMAEIGVVLLMFTIGLEFSIKSLVKIRRIVFVGGFIQVILTAGAFTVVSHFYELDLRSSIFIGFIVALSSSALVLKIMQERAELTSNYGRTILGILIFQDLLLVPLLLFTDFLGNGSDHLWLELTGLLIKMAFIGLVIFTGTRWIVPWLFNKIALAKSQELFTMSIFLICLSIALLTSELGMSLAFGAFLGGLMISDTEYSHQAFGNLVSFKDTFTSFFFVSIGMLLNMDFVIENLPLVVWSVVLVLFIKALIAGGTGFLLGHTFKGTILVGLALSQVGEFSFLLAKMGFKAELINSFFYQLFIAVAVLTMSATPFLMKLGNPLSDLLAKLPLPRFLVQGLYPLPELVFPEMKNHLVIIGKDIRAQNLAIMSRYISLPYVSIVFDPIIVKQRQLKGEPVIYGDAINEPILYKAHVDKADIVTISVGDKIAATAIVEKVRKLNKHAFIIMRAKYIDDIEAMYKNGADQVVPEKFEIAIDLFTHILRKRLLPNHEINQMLAQIRGDYYGIFRDKNNNPQHSILDQLPDFDISAIRIPFDSEAVNKTVAETQLRNKTGVTLVALKRGIDIISHPGPTSRFKEGDIAYVIGNPEQINQAIKYLNPEHIQT